MRLGTEVQSVPVLAHAPISRVQLKSLGGSQPVLFVADEFDLLLRADLVGSFG